MNLCPTCGHTAGNARFCNQCGTQLDPSAPPPPRRLGDTFEHLFRRSETATTAHLPAVGTATRVRTATRTGDDGRLGDDGDTAGPATQPMAATVIAPRPASEPTRTVLTPFAPPDGADPHAFHPHRSRFGISGPDALGPDAYGLAGLGIGTPHSDDPAPSMAPAAPGRRLPFGLVAGLVLAAMVALGIGGAFLLSNSRTTPPATTPTTAVGANAALAPSAAAASDLADALDDEPSDDPDSSSPAATTSGRPAGSLGPGSTGSRVTWLQKRLAHLGYYHGQPTGTFDAATEQAVEQFQAATHVTGDQPGIVSTATTVALDAAGTTPDLSDGQRGPDVRRLQVALNAAGFPAPTNSHFDAQTAQALRQYQTSVNVPATGRTDAATWAALQSGR